MSEREPAVQLAGVSVVRGGRRVLRDVDLAIPGGRITGLLGPSGCGKTTLMRCVVGVQRRVTGDVRLLGRPAGDPWLRPRIGYMTQAASVYNDLTVRENLRYFAAVQGVDPARIGEVLATVDLEPQADQPVVTLSGGQSARASLAVAMLNRPPVLVLDEPTVGLDPVLRRDLWASFRKLAAEGAALLVSTHVMDEAVNCDAVVLMRDGRIVATGAPDELTARTRTSTIEQAFLAIVEGAE